jgi:cell fate (sporulation/competence/biofilm development) regulator YlbF (YheA/YmcA/DUF963 family)
MEDWNDSKEILEAVRELSETLKNSRLYQSYRRSRVQLERHPDVIMRLRLFKQIHADNESKPYNFEEEKAASHWYAELTRSAAAAAFLEREQALLDVYRQMLDTIDGAWDIDIF